MDTIIKQIEVIKDFFRSQEGVFLYSYLNMLINDNNTH